MNSFFINAINESFKVQAADQSASYFSTSLFFFFFFIWWYILRSIILRIITHMISLKSLRAAIFCVRFTKGNRKYFIFYTFLYFKFEWYISTFVTGCRLKFVVSSNRWRNRGTVREAVCRRTQRIIAVRSSLPSFYDRHVRRRRKKKNLWHRWYKWVTVAFN